MATHFGECSLHRIDDTFIDNISVSSGHLLLWLEKLQTCSIDRKNVPLTKILSFFLLNFINSHIKSEFEFFFDLCCPALQNANVKCEYHHFLP